MATNLQINDHVYIPISAIGAIAFIAILLVAIIGVTADKPGAAIQDALSSFANPLIWLIGFSIMISRGLIKTRLGARTLLFHLDFR